MRPHHHRHFHRPVPLAVHLEDFQRLARADEEAGAVGPDDLRAVERDVADAGLGVLDEAHAGGDVAARVLFRRPHRRQAREVHLLAQKHHVLHRRILARHGDGRDPPGDALDQGRDRLALADAQRHRPFAPVGHQLRRDAPPGMTLHVLEQARLAELGERAVRHRRHVLVGIDLGGEADELALLLEIGEMGAERLVAHV